MKPLEFLLFAFLLPSQLGFVSATWNQNPTSNDWNTAENWTPADVPNGTSDTANFGTSTITDISNTAEIALWKIIFAPDASAYTLTGRFSFFFVGGVFNQSGVTQNILVTDTMLFSGSCTAGSNVVYTDHGAPLVSEIEFYGTSTAESATFMIIGDDPDTYGPSLNFNDGSTAANSVIVNQGDISGAVTLFYDSSTAGNSTIFTYSNSSVTFNDSTKGGNATLVADGGTILFQENSTGETARIELVHGGLLNLTDHKTKTPIDIGSLEGDSTALVSLGAQQLNIGWNGLSTTYEGMIAGVGSLVKVGDETLTLTAANIYRGGTAVNGGTLLVEARTGSATGSGPVNVNAGTLAGKGSISGAVTVGTGTGTGAHLAPGNKGPDKLTIRKALTFRADGSYKCDLSLGQAKADQVNAGGVAIEEGAQFVLQPKGFQTLPIGTVFTVINNTAATPISGAFANLIDGSVITATAGNKLQVGYEGGDGNDLTLTVVP